MASQQNVDAWWTWATGVLHGIGAPTNATNFQTLWKWSVKESGQDPISNGAIHNNPLNTTQRWPGSTSQNSVGVQSFPDVSSGISATVATLTNGRYPQIITNLKGSVPASSWLATGGRGTPTTGGVTSAELGTWGSGTNWLSWGNSPPKPSANFQATSGVSSLATGGNPIGDAVGSALSGALSPIGTAIQAGEQDLVQKATYVMLMIFGAIFMLGGVALIAVMALKYVPEPVKRVAGAVTTATPVGRAAAVTSSVAKKAPAAPAQPAAAPVASPKRLAYRDRGTPRPGERQTA